VVEKKKHQPKLTDAERYQRFLEAAKTVGASDDPKDFDRAFAKVARARRIPNHTKPKT
jgi:hypothetical protein